MKDKCHIVADQPFKYQSVDREISKKINKSKLSKESGISGCTCKKKKKKQTIFRNIFDYFMIFWD